MVGLPEQEGGAGQVAGAKGARREEFRCTVDDAECGYTKSCASNEMTRNWWASRRGMGSLLF